jgi:hypothetical protein
MKKMILALAILVSTLSAFAGNVNVSEKVLNAFKTEFITAKEVVWSAGSNYYKATFNFNGKYVFAFYSENGELLGLTRYISPTDLPFLLQNSLKKNYADYWVSDLFEVSKNGEINYCITLENADSKVVLNSSGTAWDVYHKIKKA